MQKPRPTPLAISYGRVDSVKNSGGVLWNIFAERAPDDAKTPVSLIGSPGQVAFATCGATGTVCDAVLIHTTLYVATTTGLFSITSAGVVTSLGAITVLPLARMAANEEAISIVDGVSTWNYTLGGAAPHDATAESEYFPAASVTYIDGYLVYEAVGTGRFFHTELNSLEVDPLSLSSAEAYSDFALCVFAHRRQLWVFGTQSIEHFYNAGGTASAFSRIDGTTIPHGIASATAVAANEQALAYLSADGIVYMASGFVPQQISTQAIHDALDGVDTSTATMHAYTQNGHQLFQLTVGNASWAFDVSTGLWHGLRDETYGRHRATFVLNAFDKMLMGDVATNQVRELRMNAYSNVDDTLVADIISPALHADQRSMVHSLFEIELDTGEGDPAATIEGEIDLIGPSGFDLTTSDGVVLTIDGEVETYPVVSLRFSDDDGYTWSDPEEESLGYEGEWNVRPQWRRLGAAKSRRYRVEISSPVPRRLLSRAFLQVK